MDVIFHSFVGQVGQYGLAQRGTVGRNRASHGQEHVFVVGALDHVDDFLAVPHAQIADAVVLFVLLCQVVQKLRDDIVKFPLGHHALAQFAQSVREAVAVVLILVHIAVEPERVEKAVAGAFLNAHAFCHAGHGNGFFLHQIFKYLQAFFKGLDKSVAVLGHTFLTSKVGRGKSTPGGRAANLGLGAMKSQFDHSSPIFFAASTFSWFGV